MNVTDRIEQLRKQKNWSVYKLCNEADITQSTLTNMYARGTYPSLATLINICKAFGITLSEFFDENEKNNELTLQEKELIKEFRSLSDKQKDAIRVMMKTLVEK